MAATAVERTAGESDATVSGIHEALGELRTFSDADLRNAASAWRQRAEQPLSAESLEGGCALAGEALRRAVGVELYDQQWMAALTMLAGRVAEMQTGEGKTFACFPVAVTRGLLGRGVHVITPNAYLARRDQELLSPAFTVLGLSCGLLPENCAAEVKRAAYACDVTYGPGYEFGFDYLRDQLRLRASKRGRLGTRTLQCLVGEPDVRRALVQRGLATAIIDEIDNVLLDDATSPLVLSEDTAHRADDAEAHLAARQTAQELQIDIDFLVDPVVDGAWLTPAGIARIHAQETAVPLHWLKRTWTEYVEHALRAEWLMRRDQHYIVQEGEVRIVDTSTGRIFQDRSWRDGLHQAVEAKEGVEVTAERVSLLQITRQRFFRLYENRCGMTGTATGCETEFRRIYGLAVSPVPLRRPCQRELWPWRTFRDVPTKYRAITASVRELQRVGRPCLIGTRTIADSECLAGMLATLQVPFRLLNGRQDAAEAEIVARAGELGAVTIATNLAGRGTDIRLQPEVVRLGGLHVIVAECQDSARMDRQLIGRCARQGDPGSAQFFVSGDDGILRRHGAWLARYIHQHADPDGELRQDVSAQFRRVQRSAESADYAARAALLRRDRSHDHFFQA